MRSHIEPPDRLEFSYLLERHRRPAHSGNLQIHRLKLRTRFNIPMGARSGRGKMTDATIARKRTGPSAETDSRELDIGFIRLYILYRASVDPISSRGIAEMLGHRGLTVSTRSISQFCLGLKKKGYLRSAEAGRRRQHRSIYRVTNQGRRAIEQARGKLRWAGSDVGRERRR
jgi:PadR family transcriptional regulator PadR